jgi:hypothetical protein
VHNGFNDVFLCLSAMRHGIDNGNRWWRQALSNRTNGVAMVAAVHLGNFWYGGPVLLSENMNSKVSSGTERSTIGSRACRASGDSRTMFAEHRALALRVAANRQPNRSKVSNLSGAVLIRYVMGMMRRLSALVRSASAYRSSLSINGTQ